MGCIHVKIDQISADEGLHYMKLNFGGTTDWAIDLQEDYGKLPGGGGVDPSGNRAASANKSDRFA